MSGEFQRLWRCDCGDLAHIVSIAAWGDDSDGYFLVSSDFRPSCLWDRLSVALRMLLRGHWNMAGVVVNSDTAREMREALTLLESR